MRFWWVNQNQTFRQELGGGYLWSPKRNANGARNPFYEFMREVAPGDVIFSFVDTRIAAIGVAISYCYESPKPTEFGEVGLNWELIGWRVRVSFTQLARPIRPKDHIALLQPLLPPRYSPLQLNGNGIQSVYLTSVPEPLAQTLIGLIGAEAQQLLRQTSTADPAVATGAPNADIEIWEHHLEEEIQEAPIPITERDALIVARRGQGLFKGRVITARCSTIGWRLFAL